MYMHIYRHVMCFHLHVILEGEASLPNSQVPHPPDKELRLVALTLVQFFRYYLYNSYEHVRSIGYILCVCKQLVLTCMYTTRYTSGSQVNANRDYFFI